MSQNQPSKHYPVQFGATAWSWVLVWSHVIAGLANLFFQFPFATQETKNTHIQKWSKRLLSIFGIELRFRNPEILPTTPTCWHQTIFLGWTSTLSMLLSLFDL
jgi:1-acyl-sn-glycerol-3-phosphate acyltransferase